MSRLIVVIVVITAWTRIASADDPLYSCREAAPDAKLTATFKPDIALKELIVWVAGFSCKNIVVDSAVAQRATKMTIIAPTRMTPKQAMALFVDAVEATGLVVVQKPDTLIIKQGPGMPKRCPDVSQPNPAGKGAAARRSRTCIRCQS